MARQSTPPPHPKGSIPDTRAARDPALEPELPDDIRRRDQPISPDNLPRPDLGIAADGRPESADGGSDQHPIHDEDLEDRGPEDYEKDVDDAERASWLEHPEGSAPPLDRLTQDREPPAEKE